MKQALALLLSCLAASCGAVEIPEETIPAANRAAFDRCRVLITRAQCVRDRDCIIGIAQTYASLPTVAARANFLVGQGCPREMVMADLPPGATGGNPIGSLSAGLAAGGMINTQRDEFTHKDVTTWDAWRSPWKVSFRYQLPDTTIDINLVTEESSPRYDRCHTVAALAGSESVQLSEPVYAIEAPREGVAVTVTMPEAAKFARSTSIRFRVCQTVVELSDFQLRSLAQFFQRVLPASVQPVRSDAGHL